MLRLKTFIKTTLLGGIIVVLPVLFLVVFLRWIIGLVIRIVRPLTQLIMYESNLQRLVANLISIVIIVGGCFLIGLLVKTKLGSYFFKKIESHILKIAPGYTLFKETVKQLLSAKKKPFSRVALVEIYSGQSKMTAFITDDDGQGKYTVFIHSALNPTTGLICHLDEKHVFPLDISVETAMRTIISCGAGSAVFLEEFRKKYPAAYKNL